MEIAASRPAARAEEAHVLNEAGPRRARQRRGHEEQDDQPGVKDPRKYQSPAEGPGQFPAARSHRVLSLMSIGSVMTPRTSMPAFRVMSMTRTTYPQVRDSSARR